MNGAQVAGVQLLGIVKAPRHFERHSHVTQWRPDWLAGAGGFAPAHLGLKPVGTESKRTVTLAGAYTWHDGAGRKIITMTPEFLGIRGFIHFVLFLISFYFGKAAVVAKSTMSLLCPRTSI